MSEPVLIPGGRDVAGRLDRADADSVVVACPPDPRAGGSRSDPRLRAVSDALGREVACLRFDYGPWDDARGPALCTTDAENALSWANDRFDRVGLFGYSFGAVVALRTAAEAGPAACSVLAPPADAADALGAVDCPVQVVVGDRDTAVDPTPVVDRAGALDHPVETLPATHQFRLARDRMGRLVAAFLSRRP
ncbi:alpha/beta hydrolase [Haloarcula sp. S1CR25-12]|uniref:Alpha/beta hydrolase n=1 Tax=Haloarcula saliterrae TaxID=2950534 RepID=A0ABU2FCQ9_9EURY|nr:alpha/beta hydrolase [Haloarcula sp. S1CR25-12]MDS0259630.1 alpha/beta hydrolase [Haloarcula sp. S1CR25-12]